VILAPVAVRLSVYRLIFHNDGKHDLALNNVGD